MSTASLFSQFRLLMWKNFVLRWRRPFLLAMELLSPILIILILAIVRIRDLRLDEPICHFPSKPLPSAGTIPWLQSVICNFNNTCQPVSLDAKITSLNKTSEPFSPFERIQVLFSSFSNDRNDLKELSSLLEDLIISLKDLQPSNNASDNATASQMQSFAGLMCGKDSDLYRLLSKIPRGPSSPEKVNGSTEKGNITNQCKQFFESPSRPMRLMLFALKPLLTGKLYYTPNTKLTEEFIKKANETFHGLAKFSEATEQWRSDVGQNVRTRIYNSSKWNTLRNFCPMVLNKPELCKFIKNNPSNTKTFNWEAVLDMIDTFLKELGPVMRCFEFNKFIPFDTESEMIETMSKKDNFWAGIIFEGIPKTSNATITDFNGHVTIRLRMKSSMIDSTVGFKVHDKIWKHRARENPVSDLKYFTYGFIFLQDILGQAVSKTLNSNTFSIQPTLIMQQFPYPCYIDDKFTSALAGSLPLFLVLGWIVSVSMTVRSIVYEKEIRMKEVMKIMGLSNEMLWLGWFTITGILMTASSIALTLIIKFGRVLYFSSGLVVFLFLFSFMIATLMQAFLISVFFNKANIGAVCAGIIYFVLYLPFIVVRLNEHSINVWGNYAFCLLGQVAVSIGCRYLVQYEEQGVGIQFSNIWQSSDDSDPFSLGQCIIMLWIDALLYWLATWYIEAVFPGSFGVPRVWYFPLTRNFWCGNKRIGDTPHGKSENKNNREAAPENSLENFEPGPSDGIIGVSIKQLSKMYKKGSKPAVDNLNVDFYENQITSFLGHNGAGKTTTISILTGLYTPTSGTASIYGRDIVTDMDAIRHNLGICPQYNVLFEYLTVEEHIYFFGLLKGMNSKVIHTEIDKFVKDVGLPHKRKDLSMNLSGGMKRKLSVAMAFVGGSKVVVLDEPTAGVDPFARRSIWDLLVSCRKDRTIILTTHHMDEADVLGDRIAIISRGSLKCCGSSIFLKNLFGDGYNLTLVKEKESINDSATTTLTEFIKTRVSDSLLIEESNTEWLYQLPHTGLNNGTFKTLFEALDNKYNELGVTSYGISDTSLEEVFLKVAHDPSDEFNEKTVEKLTDGGTYPRPVTRLSFRKSETQQSTFSPEKQNFEQANEVIYPVKTKNNVNCGAGSYQVTGHALIRMQFIALWIKRFHHMRRNKSGFFAELLVPVLFILLAVILSSIVPGVQQNPPMPIQPWLLQAKRGDTNLNVFYSNVNSSDNVLQKLVSMLRTPLGLGGVRCMDSNIHSISTFPCMPKDKTKKWSAVPKDIYRVLPSCECWSTGHLECSKEVPKPSSKYFAQTTDYLHDLTRFNISDWILSTSDDYRRRRYGGFVFSLNVQKNRNKMFTSIRKLIGENDTAVEKSFWENVAIFFDTAYSSSPYNIVTWFNNKGYVSAPAYLSVLQNNLLRFNISEEKASQIGISFVNHPISLDDNQILAQLGRSVQVDMLVSICVVFALAFIPASFLIFLIDERISNSKHLQFVSGVNPYVYWIANYVWDIINYILPCFICILIFIIFNRQTYVSHDNIGPFILLLILYGITIIPLMYQASFIFSTPSTAFVIVSSINLLLGMVSTLAVFIIERLEAEDADLKSINNIFKVLFLILPQYCLGRGLFELSRMHILASLPIMFAQNKNRLAWDNIGKNVFCLCIQCVIFIVGVLLIERRCCCSQRQGKVKDEFLLNPSDQDDDVRIEQERILNGDADIDPVRLINLTKVYPGKKRDRPAVNQLCLGVRKGECFGFLGVNGAGKTTTFKMLTGQESVTQGNAYISSFSIVNDMISVHKRIGYCPQFDALNNLLTGRETLWLYARLRGIPKPEIDGVVNWALQRLSLEPHADKSAGLYSGGNKRKLSTAVALIGNPDVIFLDEPTSGMDPGAKRFLWNCIIRIVKEGRSVVLTTHGMEECEALCQRLCIMVNGTLKCLGSIQHLKNKFGKGYTLALKLSNTNSRFTEVQEFMLKHFPSARLKESNYTLLEYEITGVLKLSDTFVKLQIAKNDLQLFDDYTISQTTLDQVFINFAKNQSDLCIEDAPSIAVMPNVVVSKNAHYPTTSHPSADVAV